MSPRRARLGQLSGPADDALCEFGEAIVSAGYLGDLVYDAGEGLLEEYKGWAVAARLLIDIHAEWSEEPESSPLDHRAERFIKKEKTSTLPRWPSILAGLCDLSNLTMAGQLHETGTYSNLITAC
ncbi:hypothetical protein FDENT_13776 [Fusarium denticulatum]|uniref:Uncharacterized protein n=1 Tax=Fusarium denticulatum TaxID=48507 RepID=A0A8H5SZ96_9HYPO|nr:hypothetical protein FDENT_13776 [Fusarium denticulatum]